MNNNNNINGLFDNNISLSFLQNSNSLKLKTDNKDNLKKMFYNCISLKNLPCKAKIYKNLSANNTDNFEL